jgi:hypothetical protein
LLFGAEVPFAATTPLLIAGACVCVEALFVGCKSAAHDDIGFLAGGEAFGVSSALGVGSTNTAGEVPACWGCCLSAADLTDFCVVDVTLGAFAERIGIRGTAGIVAVRV